MAWASVPAISQLKNKASTKRRSSPSVPTRRNSSTTCSGPGPPSAWYFAVGGRPNAWQRSSEWIRLQRPSASLRSNRSTTRHLLPSKSAQGSAGGADTEVSGHRQAQMLVDMDGVADALGEVQRRRLEYVGCRLGAGRSRPHAVLQTQGHLRLCAGQREGEAMSRRVEPSRSGRELLGELVERQGDVTVREPVHRSRLGAPAAEFGRPA